MGAKRQCGLLCSLCVVCPCPRGSRRLHQRCRASASACPALLVFRVRFPILEHRRYPRAVFLLSSRQSPAPWAPDRYDCCWACPGTALLGTRARDGGVAVSLVLLSPLLLASHRPTIHPPNYPETAGERVPALHPAVSSCVGDPGEWSCRECSSILWAEWLPRRSSSSAWDIRA